MGTDVDILTTFYLSYLADRPGEIFPGGSFVRITRLKLVKK